MTEAGGASPSAAAKIDRMGTEGTFKLLLEFSIPAVVGVLVQMLYNVIDAVYVGHAVGADGLAATTVANPTMTALVAVAMLVGVGGNALAAIKLGERRRDMAERVVGTSLVLLLGAAALLWIGLSVRARAHPALLGRRRGRASPRARLQGGDHRGLPAAVHRLRHEQLHPHGGAAEPRASDPCSSEPLSNVVLGYLFIIVLDGGMRGAGLATVCSWGVSAAFVMQFFLKKDSPLRSSGPCAPSSPERPCASAPSVWPRR